MKSLTIRTLLILSLTAPAFAGNPSTIDEPTKQVDTTPEVTPATTSPIGTLEQLSERLLELTEPMEQKVDDCDGEVKAAKTKLAELQASLKTETNTVRKLFAEILVLKESLSGSGCEINIGGTNFRRELVADGMEKRMQKYQQTAEAMKQLRSDLDAQKKVVANAVAKLERWQAKEKELLQSVEALQNAHADLLGADGQEVETEKLEQAQRVETEVKAMLKPTVQKIVVQESAVVEADIPETATESKNADVSVKTTESIDVEVLPTQPESNEKNLEDNKASEVTVDLEVEANLETDTEFNLEILDEIFERP